MPRKKKLVPSNDLVSRKPETTEFEPLAAAPTMQKREGKTWGKPQYSTVRNRPGKTAVKRDTKAKRWINPDHPEYTTNPTPKGTSKATRQGRVWVPEKPPEDDDD